MQITEQTLKDFQSGRIGAFYEEVYPSLITYAARLLKEDFSFLSEDCVQDAVFIAYKRRMEFISPVIFKSFLYTCVHNNAVSLLRKNNSHDNYMKRFHENIYDIENTIIEQETLDMLYEAIEKLPTDMHRVFELCFEKGLKNAEAASILGISESMLKKRKKKMISLLRETFKDNVFIQILLWSLLEG